MPHQSGTQPGGRITPRAYLTYCQSQLDAAIGEREDVLSQLAAIQHYVCYWGANTQEAQQELDAEEAAQLLADALGVGRSSGPLVEFEGDIFDEVAAL
jgi:hypothetical protein